MLSNKNENDKNELAGLMTYTAKLLEIAQAAAVKVPQDVLDQGSEAQSPAEEPPPKPTPPDQNAGKGTSGSNPDRRKQNYQAPSASE